MKLTLQRLFFTQRSTCGELFIDSQQQRFCYTLELPVKDGLPGSAIPPGTYRIALLASPRFMQAGEKDSWVAKYATAMPHLEGIPNRSLIMLHWGNAPENTDGCILVGNLHDLDTVGDSRTAFERLYPLLSDGDTLEVQGGVPHEPHWPNE